MIRFEVLGKRPAILKPIDLERIAARTSASLRLRKPLSVSLSFVSETKMKTLNKRYMKKDRPTDVLSFPASSLGLEPIKGERVMGDLFVCVPYAAREAKRRSIPVREELARLIIHGILHLAGFDHATARDEARMFALQERLIEAVFTV
jgi:probable rRNA maturation factor